MKIGNSVEESVMGSVSNLLWKSLLSSVRYSVRLSVEESVSDLVWVSVENKTILWK